MKIYVSPPHNAASPFSVSVPASDAFSIANSSDVVAYARPVGLTSTGPYTRIPRRSSVRVIHTEAVQTFEVYAAPAASYVSGDKIYYRPAVLEFVTVVNATGIASDTDVTQVEAQAGGGYEFTGAFTARTNELGQSGANDFGTFVGYTQAMVDADQWLRFGFNTAAQAANDVAYWTDPDPALDPDFDQSKGLFGGAHLPTDVGNLFDFDFSDPSYSDEVTGQSLNYTAAGGSFDFSECSVGDLALVRFDFNVIPQVSNTTLEIALIWQTRLADGTPTFAFPLTGTPIFYGAGSTGQTFLNRPILSAYFASNEDVNARALLAIKADNPIQVAPLTTLAIINR